VGTVELFELSFDSPALLNGKQSSAFRIATLRFNTLAAANNSPLAVTVNAFGDASGNSVPASIQNGAVSNTQADPNAPSITSGGIVPVYSASTTTESGSWTSIYGKNLATTTAMWNGNFPTLLGGTSVTIDSRPAYLWFVSPTQINVQAPDNSAAGTVVIVVTTAAGTASSTVTLGQYGPSFSLFNGMANTLRPLRQRLPSPATAELGMTTSDPRVCFLSQAVR